MSFRLTLAFLAFGILPIGTNHAAETPPNIIIILADDMGYGDCTAYNPESKIPTPHIDQLASEGLRFTDAHAPASTCTPSRYGLLTGINPQRTGVRNTLLGKGLPVIDETETTIAEVLKKHGYLTEMIGKWHLGFDMDTGKERPAFDFSKPLTSGPIDRGFDRFFGVHSSAGAQPLCYFEGRGVVSEPTEKFSYQDEHKTINALASPGFSLEGTSPLFCKKAIETIKRQAASEQDKPFFLYYSSIIPHKPWVPTEAFRGKSQLGPYGDFVMQLDDVVGQINRALKETGLDQNTIVIFTSDNGPGPPSVKAMAADGHASAGGLRGSKADAWEGGHRVPLIVKWPVETPPDQTTSATVNLTDIFATLTEMLETDLPEGAVNSHSFLSVLHDPQEPHSRPPMVQGRHSVRLGNWKIVAPSRNTDAAKLEQSHFQLFNLDEDLTEQNNLSKKHPEKFEQLHRVFTDFVKQRRLKAPDVIGASRPKAK